MNFQEKVISIANKIPRGRVATYGQIAAMVYTPRAARAVGLVLRNLSASTKVPWHRVINAHGMISIENLNIPKQEQVRRLQKEGIEVELKNGNYWADLKKYLWRPK